MNPWLQITAFVKNHDEPHFRPMYGNGKIGDQDPTLNPKQGFGIGITKRTIYPNDEVMCQKEVATPWGVAEGNGDGLYPIGRSPAHRAAMRVYSQGHFRLYTKTNAYWVLRNEGIEYGITSYDNSENYGGRTRKLRLAAEAAIQARNSYLEERYGDWLDVEIMFDDREALRLINEAERAKVNLIKYLGAPEGEEPLENEPFTEYTIVAGAS